MVKTRPVAPQDSLTASPEDTIKNVSIDEAHYLTTELIIFPNPARDVLNVSLKSDFAHDFRIINAAGQTAYASQLDSESLQIDLSRFAPGFYFVEIMNQNAVLRKRLVIQ